MKARGTAARAIQNETTDDGHVTPEEIAILRQAGVPSLIFAPKLVPIVDKLVDRGLLTRAAPGGDRRIVKRTQEGDVAMSGLSIQGANAAIVKIHEFAAAGDHRAAAALERDLWRKALVVVGEPGVQDDPKEIARIALRSLDVVFER
jgi:hypothetical protein